MNIYIITLFKNDGWGTRFRNNHDVFVRNEIATSLKDAHKIASEYTELGVHKKMSYDNDGLSAVIHLHTVNKEE